jgi:DNA repair protein RadA/Sms
VGATRRERLMTGIAEFDRVLGGGVVMGSLVLIGGDPGIGKSTLLLEAAVRLASTQGSGMYLSAKNRRSKSACGPTAWVVLQQFDAGLRKPISL